MQHQIRRWDGRHRGEIETAFFNGSGMLIWGEHLRRPQSLARGGPPAVAPSGRRAAAIPAKFYVPAVGAVLSDAGPGTLRAPLAGRGSDDLHAAQPGPATEERAALGSPPRLPAKLLRSLERAGGPDGVSRRSSPADRLHRSCRLPGRRGRGGGRSKLRRFPRPAASGHPGRARTGRAKRGAGGRGAGPGGRRPRRCRGTVRRRAWCSCRVRPSDCGSSTAGANAAAIRTPARRLRSGRSSCGARRTMDA